MYCSGCGSQIQPGLSFCSRCGKRVAGEWNQADRPRSPLTVAGNIAGVGFVAFIFVLLVLVLNGVTGSNIVGVTFFYFLALSLVCMMFLRQSRYYRPETPREVTADPQLYVKPATTAQLPEGIERPASVTEHTTRTLQDVPLGKR
jgi:hypothetical protein